MKIETGLLLTGAEPVKNGIHDVWHATVRVSPKKNVKAFVKKCPPRELVIEVVASLIGRSLGLPLPIPILVKVTPGRIAQLELNGPEIFFGTQSQKEPDLSQIIQSDADQQIIMQRLRSWPNAAFAGCFDEWIANEDRNLQNLLYDGGKNFVLIDHGKAIPEGLGPLEPTSSNFLLHLSSNKPTPSAKKKTQEQGGEFIKKCNKMKLDDLLLSVADLLDKEESFTPEIQFFLEQRLSELGEIISRKLGDQGHGSLFTP